MAPEAVTWNSIRSVTPHAILITSHPNILRTPSSRYIEQTTDLDGLPSSANLIAVNLPDLDMLTAMNRIDRGASPGSFYAVPESVVTNNPPIIRAEDQRRSVSDGRDVPAGSPSGGGEPPDPPFIEGSGAGRHARVVNAWFVGHPDPDAALTIGQQYILRIEIHPQVREGNVIEGEIEFSEPELRGDELLDVAVALISNDFEIIGKPVARMRLPKDKAKGLQ